MNKMMILGLFGVACSFGAPIPLGWNCTGNCGSSAAADGVVTLPTGASQVLWTSTDQGISGVGSLAGIGGTNGSVLTSPQFSALSNEVLSFQFNFVTSDGAQFADYAWARLTPQGGTPFLLFTARTTPAGSTVPGFGMPAIGTGVTVNPLPVSIIGGGPVWSPLGGDSGGCFSTGCGYTGWVSTTYAVPTAGIYTLELGVTNFLDTAFDSGLAIAQVKIGEVSIDNPVPEPSTYALMGIGLAAMVYRRSAKR